MYSDSDTLLKVPSKYSKVDAGEIFNNSFSAGFFKSFTQKFYIEIQRIKISGWSNKNWREPR